MSDEHKCLHEERWGKVLTQLEIFTSKVCKHIEEGEKEGGFRDRLLKAEVDIKFANESLSTIKKSYWKACIVSGLIGGLIGKLTPDMMNLVYNSIFANILK